MIEIEQSNDFYIGWVDGRFIAIHSDLEVLVAILKGI